MSNTNLRNERAEIRDNGPIVKESNTMPRSEGARGLEELPRDRHLTGIRNGKLQVPEELLDPNYHYHWINDNPVGRIDEYLYIGYQFVSRKEIALPTMSVQANSDTSDKVSRIVGQFGPNEEAVRSYLMKIEKWKYEERQAHMQEPCDRVDEAIRRGKLGVGGEAKNMYLPKGKNNQFERD